MQASAATKFYRSLPMGKQKPTDNLPMGDEAMVYYAHKPMLSPSDSLVSVDALPGFIFAPTLPSDSPDDHRPLLTATILRR